MKTLKFSEISSADFTRIYGEMTNLVRKDLEGETFFSGSHAEFGEITIYQPGHNNKAVMLLHDNPVSGTRFDTSEFSISLSA